MSDARIFVSYCHQDIDMRVRDMLLADLEEQAGVEVISDRLAQVGDDVERFMALIGQCQAVVVLCTPEYKRRIDARTNSVYFEYKAILDAYELANRDFANQHKDFQQYDDPLKAFVSQARDHRFAILPILMSGSQEESIPAFFLRKMCADFTGLLTTSWKSTGKTRPQKSFRNMYDTTVSHIRHAAADTLALRRSDQDSASHVIFDRIFRDLKHHPGSLNRRELSSLFVKTLEFQRVSTQQSYILVGRKGSGKSTLADFVTHGPSNKWKPPVLYNVDDLPLELLYTICSSEQHRSDHRYVISRSRVMQFAWEALLHYLCLRVLSQEMSADRLIYPQKQRLLKIHHAFEILSGNASNLHGDETAEGQEGFTIPDHHSFFAYALSSALGFLSLLIAKAPSAEAEFTRYLAKNLTPEHFLIQTFGREFLSVFYQILMNCRRNFLIALDGFDSNFQRFRHETLQSYAGHEVFADRTKFEQDWLSGLVAAVRRYKRPIGTTPMAGRIDFCVTIPKDRFIEFTDFDRDAFEWQGKKVDISWTGIELAILLRKRLEVYKKFQSDKAARPLVRLSEVLRNRVSSIPEFIEVALDKTTAKLDVFQYIIRHTFWRPRDVLCLAGQLVAVADYYHRHDLKLDQSTVKLVVAKNLHTIIEFEFFQEFGSALRNLRGVVERFRGAKQVLGFDEFFALIRGMRPEYPVVPDADIAGSGPSDHERILSMLFNIGFIGFYLNGKSAVNTQFQTQWVFVFNEGDIILKMLSGQNRREMQVVIHPMFVEYLGLSPYREALVCEFPHEYLAKQEAHQLAR